MSETTTEVEMRAGLVITGLYFPDSDGPVPTDWSELVFTTELGHDDTRPSYATLEVVDAEYEGQTYQLLARDNYPAGVIVDGVLFDHADIVEQVEEAESDALDRYPDVEIEDDPDVKRWTRYRDVLDHFIDEGSLVEQGAEGPMMNFFYPVSDHVRGTVEGWAVAIADLPLCVVVLDDARYGLALTGGGMDLSWEIAEAFIRCGYYPPTWCDLPADANGISVKRRAIATALATHYRAEMRRLDRRLRDLATKYGVGPLEEG